MSTRGLPMLVREYVEALRSAGPTPEAPETSETSKPGALGSAGADWWPPASVRDLLRTRLQAVSEPTLQMLTAAAVLGSAEPLMNRRVWPGGGCCPVGPPTSSSAGTSVIRPVPGPRPWPAICSWPAGTARRRSGGGGPVSWPVNFTRTNRRMRTWSGPWRSASRSSPGRIALGDVLVALGRYREALADVETAAAIASGGEDDRATQAGIEHKLADVHHRLGDWELAEAHLAIVTELVEGAEPGRLAWAQADRAVVAYRRGDPSQAAVLGQAALACARAAGDPEATAQALNVLGMLAARAGDASSAETYLRDSLAEARRRPETGAGPGTSGVSGGKPPPSAPLGAAVAALNNLARLLAETGRGTEALALAAEALELGSELGDQHPVAALHTNLADLLHADGQRDAAMAHLKEAARRFASVEVGDAPRPEIWTLVEW